MALKWQIGNIENWEELWIECSDGSKELNAITNYLVWSTMSIGVRGITEENWEKFYSRLRSIEAVQGMTIYDRESSDDKWTPRNVTKDDIKRHIGLTTNASEITPHQFKKKLVSLLEQKFGEFG